MYLTAANFDNTFSELTEDSEQFQLKCLNIAKGIEEKETTLIDFIDAAGPYLIDKDNEKRLKGITILAAILEHLSRDVVVLDPQQIEHLCTFLINRLKDHHTVVPAVLKAISLLMALKNFPNDMIIGILNGIFQNISCQTQQPKDRLVLYKIFAFLVEFCKEEVAKMGPDFVHGVISSVENERNPENLLYLFNWYPVFCKNVKLGHLAEEMFDVLSCYFPVDFQPLNSNAISRNELANALNPGLYAITEFGDICIPLVLEKLSSHLLVAKFDSLSILMHGTSVFTTQTYLTHSTDIISTIKHQIFETDNSELKNLCSETLTSISQKLSSFEDILTNTYKMVQGNLVPTDRYYAASHLFLVSFAKGSKIAAEFIMQKIVAHFMNHYYTMQDEGIKVGILKTLHMYTQNYLMQFDEQLNENIFGEIQNLYYKAASVDESEIVKSEGIICLGLVAPYISKDIKDRVLDMLKTELVNQNSAESRYKCAVLSCFRSFAKAHSAEMNQLIQENAENVTNSYRYLEMIGSLVDLEEYSDIAMGILVTQCRKDLKSALLAIKALWTVLNFNRNHEQCSNKVIAYLVRERFVYKETLWVLSVLNEIEISKHKDFLTDLSNTIQATIRNESVENQQVLVDELLPRVLSKQESVSIVLTQALLLKLKFEFDLNIENLSFFISKCFNEVQNDFLLTIAQELVANLLNKCKSDTKLTDNLKYIMQFSEIFADNIEVATNYNYKFVPLITKALVMRGHPQASIWVKQMIAALNTSDTIINGFSIVLSDNLDSLSNLSYCAIRLFYKQRYFSEVTTALQNDPNNENYLKAFCTMLTNISNKIFLSEFKKILPLIISAMENCRDAHALLSLLNMLKITLNQNKQDIMTDNIDNILNGLLNLFHFKDSMEVRILAIQSVEEFLSGFPNNMLSKQRNIIITTLTDCIDDKKRSVRMVAADSRSKWFLFREDY